MGRAAGAACQCVCVVACMCTACVCVCKHSVPNELKITCGSAFYAASLLPTLFLPGCLPSGNSLPPGSSLAGLWQLSSSWLLSACPLATLCRRSFYYFDYSLSPHCLSACLPTCWQLPPSSCSLATLRRRSFYYFEHAAHVSSLSPVGTGCSCCRFRFVILRDTPGRTPLAPPLPPTSPTCLITLLCAKNNKQSSSRGSIKTVEHSRGYIKITAIVDEVQPHTPCHPPLHKINIKKKT